MGDRWEHRKCPQAVLREMELAESYAGMVVGSLEAAHDHATPEAVEKMLEVLDASTGPRRRTPEQLDILVRELPNLMQEAAAFRQKLRSALALVKAAQPTAEPEADKSPEVSHG